METDKKREDELISRTDLRLLARAKECWDFLKDFRRERVRGKILRMAINGMIL